MKELDYVYFAFGSLGAVMAVNRMNAVAEKLMLPDLYVPVILASALVIRGIRRRNPSSREGGRHNLVRERSSFRPCGAIDLH